MELNESNLKQSISKFLEREIADEDKLKEIVHDSFLLVELVMTLQEDYSVRIMQEDLKDVDTVSKLISAFMEKK